VALVEAVAKTTENRLPYLALAYAAAAAEENLRARGSSWRFDPAFALHWLALIETFGYPLTDAETQLRRHCRTQLENRAGDPREDTEFDAEGFDQPQKRHSRRRRTRTDEADVDPAGE
jgi:hypothetical protein